MWSLVLVRHNRCNPDIEAHHVDVFDDQLDSSILGFDVLHIEAHHVDVFDDLTDFGDSSALSIGDVGQRLRVLLVPQEHQLRHRSDADDLPDVTTSPAGRPHR